MGHRRRIAMADRAGDYIAGLFGAEDELLASLREEADRTGLPPIAISADEGRLLQVLLRHRRPPRSRVGTLGGYWRFLRRGRCCRWMSVVDRDRRIARRVRAPIRRASDVERRIDIRRSQLDVLRPRRRALTPAPTPTRSRCRGTSVGHPAGAAGRTHHRDNALWAAACTTATKPDDARGRSRVQSSNGDDPRVLGIMYRHDGPPVAVVRAESRRAIFLFQPSGFDIPAAIFARVVRVLLRLRRDTGCLGLRRWIRARRRSISRSSSRMGDRTDVSARSRSPARQSTTRSRGSCHRLSRRRWSPGRSFDHGRKVALVRPRAVQRGGAGCRCWRGEDRRVGIRRAAMDAPWAGAPAVDVRTLGAIAAGAPLRRRQYRSIPISTNAGSAFALEERGPWPKSSATCAPGPRDAGMAAHEHDPVVEGSSGVWPRCGATSRCPESEAAIDRPRGTRLAVDARTRDLFGSLRERRLSRCPRSRSTHQARHTPRSRRSRVSWPVCYQIRSRLTAPRPFCTRR